MERLGQQFRERKDSRLYFQELSVKQQIGRSAECIPRVFGNFEKCSSVDQNVGNFRRSRSFTLPSVLKKQKDTPSLIQIVFGTKTRHKRSDPKCDSYSQDNVLNKKATCTTFISKQNSKTTDGTLVRRHNFIIPKICIQTPEEVNINSNLTHPITIPLQQGSNQDLVHNQPDGIKECLEDPTQDGTFHCKTTSTDKNGSTMVAHRKRSFSWSDVYSCGDLKISTAEVLKSSSSWGAFLDSAAARETDLCSTEL